MNSFRDIDPPKAACIIHSHNYRCSNQVIELMALLHGLEDDFGQIINQPKLRKNDPGSKEKQEDFKRKMNKITSSYGDHITLHNMLETYNNFQGKKVIIDYEIGDILCSNAVKDLGIVVNTKNNMSSNSIEYMLDEITVYWFCSFSEDTQHSYPYIGIYKEYFFHL